MKHIHFIGVCGVAMSAIAIAFKKHGWIVTGSDAGFFPPISTHLKENAIDFYPGWHPEKMIHSGVPDLVVVGNVASSSNPEWLYAQEHKLNYKSYPEVVAQFIIKPNSIVCAGTYGKTTTSALLAWILTEAGYDPSYLFGGLTMTPNGSSPCRVGGGGVRLRSRVLASTGNLPSVPTLSSKGGSVLWRTRGESVFESAKIANSEWSVVEGDEYKSARWDMRPKFAHYSPTHLLLTSAVWDHADVYPTEAAYFEAFQNLVASIPPSGLLVACTDDENVRHLIASPSCNLLTYGQNSAADFCYKNIIQTRDGVAFEIAHADKIYQLTTPMLGDYQAGNITGVFAMAREIGIPAERIIAAIKNFSGMKRRLEKRHAGNITVFDDIAHSPIKAAATLQTLRQIYGKKIIAVFEPNSGYRRSTMIPAYDYAFAAADEVIIPELTKIKLNPTDPEQSLTGDQLAKIISKTHPAVYSITDDKELVSQLKEGVGSGDVIIFLGSHSFRGMIDELISVL